MNEDEPLKQKLNRETAKIHWQALEQHHQQGAVITVSPKLDLITVAVAFAEDNRTAVEKWLGESEIEKTSEKQAKAWSEINPELWAVVVAPWILVQESAKEANDSKQPSV